MRSSSIGQMLRLGCSPSCWATESHGMYKNGNSVGKNQTGQSAFTFFLQERLRKERQEFWIRWLPECQACIISTPVVIPSVPATLFSPPLRAPQRPFALHGRRRAGEVFLIDMTCPVCHRHDVQFTAGPDLPDVLRDKLRGCRSASRCSGGVHGTS